MTQKLNNPQGSSPLKGSNQPVKKFTPALLFSAFFVAISFTVMLIPLAIFNVSQVAAILGKRIAFYLMFAVSFGFMLFGNVFGNTPIAATGLFVLFSIPFFMSSIALREKKCHWGFVALIHFIPVLFILGITIFRVDKAHFDEFRNNIQLSQAVVAPLSQTPPAEKQDGTSLNKSSDKTEITDNSKQIKNEQYAMALNEQFEAIMQLPAIKEFLEYSPWQKLAYFVYGEGSLFFLIVLLICFANVVFVDFGFEQIERLRAIVNYVRRNPSAFSGQLTTSLLALPMVRANRLQTPILITQHSNNQGMQSRSDDSKLNLLSFVWKPLKPKNSIYWQGYSFKFEGTSPWSLRDFSLPLPIAILAIAIVGGIGFWYGNLETILSSLQGGVVAPFIAIASVLSFIAVAIVALQGMFTVYKRLPALLGFLLMAVFLYLSTKLTQAPYSVLALFGAVGLLDYVYDWRGKKA